MRIPIRFWDIIPVRFKTTIPSRFRPVEGDLTFPAEAYFLAPDVNGNFTKEMVETAVTNGETYIVMDADTLDVHYDESFDANHGWDSYMNLSIKATELNPVTLDFRKVYIDCYPDPLNILKPHRVFTLMACEYLTFKFGDVEGDKFKRELVTDAETYFENTQLIKTDEGTRNVTIDGGDISGFMADVGAGTPYGEARLAWNVDYFLEPDGRYQTGFLNVDSVTYSDFGLTGGVGYNRLLYYDMEDVTFKFYDVSEVFISEITGAKYYATYNFPAGTAKMKVNLRAMDGRTENPTQFGQNLDYNVMIGAVYKNMDISDNHRGGLANVGNRSTIDNIDFYNTQRYFETPVFGTAGNASTTTYHLNCEDVTSRDLLVKNCTFNDKFHAILLTHNISADIDNNIFNTTGVNNRDIFIYDLLYGSVTNNTFNGFVNLGTGTNKGLIMASGNTGSPLIELSNAASYTNNNFTGGYIKYKGKFYGNTSNNLGYGLVDFTKEIYNNTFIYPADSNPTQYINANSYIYNNTFINTGFRIQYGSLPDTIILDTVTVDYTAQPTNEAFYRSTVTPNVIAINSTFKNAKFRHRTINKPLDFIDGAWYFESCTFQDITDYVILLTINTSNTVPVEFYFKNCTFIGSGTFQTKTYGSGLSHMTFDNCTIDSNITMPPNYTLGTVTMPTIVEPRTQPIPAISYNVDRTEIVTDFHIMTLIIRNKNTLVEVLNEDVNSTYKHYNVTPNDFEYSIDGGLYWDSIIVP